ncbi:unnamed protein product [Dovyalis caffra]|uniref:Uncharacterized protein n=1 Tax=Dovyalis caffra TaxID=77055 RepID=A0AAV1SM14_9ROSI|nr:unnamed protein product [Dovyalis caffra]
MNTRLEIPVSPHFFGENFVTSRPVKDCNTVGVTSLGPSKTMLLSFPKIGQEPSVLEEPVNTGNKIRGHQPLNKCPKPPDPSLAHQANPMEIGLVKVKRVKRMAMEISKEVGDGFGECARQVFVHLLSEMMGESWV